MFQYISEIIKNISPAQRFWALLITLITIVFVTLGDDVIKAISSSSTVLENKVSSLESSNKSLQVQNSELQQIVLKSQLDCTRDITQLRQQILDEITQLEREMRHTNNPFELKRVNSVRGQGSNGAVVVDTVVASAPVPVVIQPQTSPVAMDHIKKMKRKLQEDIKKEEL
jgi:hypothetical protein